MATSSFNIGDLNGDISFLNNKIANKTYSAGGFSYVVVMGNYVTGYGCTSFVPFMRSDTYTTITLNGASVCGISGDKLSDFSVGNKYKMGFVLNCSADYSGKAVTLSFNAS